MIDVILVAIGLALSFIVYPALLIESKRGGNARVALLASSVNLAGIVIIMVVLVASIITYLI